MALGGGGGFTTTLVFYLSRWHALLSFTTPLYPSCAPAVIVILSTHHCFVIFYLAWCANRFLCFHRSGKDCALKLNLLPPGTVSSEIILDGERPGLFVRACLLCQEGVPVSGDGFTSSPPGELSNCILGGRRVQHRHTKDVRALFVISCLLSFFFLLFLHMFPLPASFLGVIERDIRSYPSSMPSTHRANMMGRSRPQEFQQSEGLIKVRGRLPQGKKKMSFSPQWY